NYSKRIIYFFINSKNNFSVGNNSRSVGIIAPTERVNFGSVTRTLTVSRGKASTKVTSGTKATPKPAETSPFIASTSCPTKDTFGLKPRSEQPLTIKSLKTYPSGNKTNDSFCNSVNLIDTRLAKK